MSSPDSASWSFPVTLPVAGGAAAPATDETRWFREEVQPYEARLRSYLRHRFPTVADVDDIVQETFIRAWRHLPRLSADDRPVRPWLFRVARNLLIDADRAARVRPAVTGSPPAENETRSLFDSLCRF